MYGFKLLKTVQSEESRARLVFLAIIHNLTMNLLCDVKQATLLFPTSFALKKTRP